MQLLHLGTSPRLCSVGSIEVSPCHRPTDRLRRYKLTADRSPQENQRTESVKVGVLYRQMGALFPNPGLQTPTTVFMDTRKLIYTDSLYLDVAISRYP